MTATKQQHGRYFVATAFILTLFGLVVLVSTSVPLSQQNFGENYFYVKHQLLFGLAIGIVLFLLGRSFNYKHWRRFSIVVYIVSIILLLLIFTQVGLSIGGARRWIVLFGSSFQPAEFAKLGLIMYWALWLDKNKARVGSFSSLIPFCIITGLIALPIILQPDIGTSMLVVLLALVMYLSAGAKWRSLAIVLLIGLLAFSALVLASPERMSRVLIFINPQTDTQGEGYQQRQALIAIGSGGFLGRGLGHSVQKYQYLPESVGDAIFAIIAEELGFLGSTVLILGFIFLILSGIKVARRAQTNYGTYLVIGIVSWFGLQAFINIGGIAALIPFTGIPLPFISYGGTALALELFAVGIVSNVSRS